MPFGPVKNDWTAQSATTSTSADLGSNPTAGNLLILCVGFRSDEGGDAAEDDGGFTLIHSSRDTEAGTNVGGSVWAKFSDGDEQTIGVSWTNSVRNVISYSEWAWVGSVSNFGVDGEEETSRTSSVTTEECSASALTPNVDASVFIGVMIGMTGSGFNTGNSFNNSFTLQHEHVGDNTFPGAMVAYKVLSSAASTNTTWTTTDGGTKVWGVLVNFEEEAASGLGIPIAMYHYMHNIGSNN